MNATTKQSSYLYYLIEQNKDEIRFLRDFWATVPETKEVNGTKVLSHRMDMEKKLGNLTTGEASKCINILLGTKNGIHSDLKTLLQILNKLYGNNNK